MNYPGSFNPGDKTDRPKTTKTDTKNAQIDTLIAIFDTLIAIFDTLIKYDSISVLLIYFWGPDAP
jgi:hypothetical protein